MAKIDFKQLLKKQMEGQLNKTDLPVFKSILRKENEEELEYSLEQLWEEYQSEGKRHSSFGHIRNMIYHMIHREKRNIIYRSMVKYAAVIILPLLMMFGVYHFTRTSMIKEFASTEYTIETASGERSRVVLPDGTNVLVSSNTRLTYPASFGKQGRKVKLTGEAFFEVSRNETLPFIVQSDEVQIKVLGTKFNVYAYSDEPFLEVALQAGRVEVISNRYPQVPVFLQPNEKVRMNYEDGILIKEQTNMRLETAWMHGDLYFRSEPLLDIFKKIERFYGVQVTYAGEVPTETFTGGYRETDIQEVLHNLQEHYTFTYEKKGNALHISF